LKGLLEEELDHHAALHGQRILEHRAAGVHVQLRKLAHRVRGHGVGRDANRIVHPELQGEARDHHTARVPVGLEYAVGVDHGVLVVHDPGAATHVSHEGQQFGGDHPDAQGHGEVGHEGVRVGVHAPHDGDLGRHQGCASCEPEHEVTALHELELHTEHTAARGLAGDVAAGETANEQAEGALLALAQLLRIGVRGRRKEHGSGHQEKNDPSHDSPPSECWLSPLCQFRVFGRSSDSAT